MRTFFDCIPCFLRQTLDAMRFIGAPEDVYESVLRGVLEQASRMDLLRPPPEMGQVIHRTIRAAVGDTDPYRSVKERATRLALERLPGLRRQVEARGAGRFESAVRIAIAGNAIDFGVKASFRDDDLDRAVDASWSAPVDTRAIEALRGAAEDARRILYIGDNAGEVVLDRLLIEAIGPSKVTFAVRGSAVLNDATREDADASGLSALVEVVDSGSDAPGTVLPDCSEDFRRRFREADLVIAKGQGNYESLSGPEAVSLAGGRLFFLLQAKCPVIAAHIGFPEGSLVVMEAADPQG